MAQPLRTEDYPRFDTYPGPESPETPAEASLQSAAEQIGSTVGRAVRAARELPERAEQIRQDLRDRLTVIRKEGGPSMADKASELKDAAQRRLGEGKQRAAELARQARARASRIVNERPLHVLLGIFAAGLIAGIALRLWRNHE
jgi:ElaB/YqjD/DUF883 family membrane-anchored ribosome-binding protein